MAKKKQQEQTTAKLEAKLQEAVARARQMLMCKPSGASTKKVVRSGVRKPSQTEQKRSVPRQTNRSALTRKVIGDFTPMKVSDFKKLPKGSPTESLVTWAWKRRLETACGRFGVEFHTEDADPPDHKMLILAEELARYAQAHSEYIREIIYGHYRYCVTEYGPNFLWGDMPADLEPEQIWNYCAPLLVVNRHPKTYYEGPPYSCGISVNPDWEPEHNLSLEFSNGAIVSVDDAPFEIVNAILRYKPGEAAAEEVPETTPAEKFAAFANQMGQMSEQLKAMLSGKSEERQRWEELFPAPPPGANVERDPSVIYCDWKLDPVETASVLTKLGEKTSVAKARKQWGNYLYRISRNILKTFAGDDLIDEQRFRECRRRGNRFDFVLHSDSIWEHWFDGKVLVDQSGLAYRRAR